MDFRDSTSDTSMYIDHHSVPNFVNSLDKNESEVEKIAKVVIKKSHNSFFGKISETSNSRIVIYVQRLYPSKNYLVIALSSNLGVLKSAKNIISRDPYLRKYKIRKLYQEIYNGYAVFYGIKSICEFYRLIEENNVLILSPYLFDKGSREYIVLGSKDDLNRYLRDLSYYYGLENVRWHEISFRELLENLIDTSISTLMIDKLTPAEKKVLIAAYRKGYFKYPKGVKQENLGATLNLSKVTVSIHLRKALKKILDDFIRFLEKEEYLNNSH